MLRRFLLLLVLALPLLAGCQFAKATGKGLLTPLVVVRDTIDVPLIIVTNASLDVAKEGVKSPITIIFSFLIFDPIQITVGAVDYVVCRSFFPSWPDGVSPWRKWEHQEWYPNTRALWAPKDFKEHLEKNPPRDPMEHWNNKFYRIAGAVLGVLGLGSAIYGVAK